MSASIFLVSCAVAILIQNVYGECVLRNSYNEALPPPWLGIACGASYENGLVPASDGGGFAVKSASPVPPSGVSVLSENEYAGIVAVAGQVPFLGTAYLEGAVPSAGAGAVNYGCGYGKVGIVSEEGANHAALSGASLARTPTAAVPWTNGWGSCGCGL